MIYTCPAPFCYRTFSDRNIAGFHFYWSHNRFITLFFAGYLRGGPKGGNK